MRTGWEQEADVAESRAGPKSAALSGQLTSLYRAAGRPSYRQIVDYCGTNRVKVTDSSVEEWISGKVVPRSGRAFGLVVQYLMIRAKSNSAAYTPPALHVWEVWRREAQQERRSSQGRKAVDRSEVKPPRRLIGWIPAAPDCFQPREQLAELVLAASGTGTAVLSGLGGVGKTQLAAGVARQLWNVGDTHALIWVSAASRGAVVTAYAAAAATMLGLDRGDPETAAAALVNWLGVTHSRWTVVLDDLADPGDLRGLWPPHRSEGRILVTTRRQDSVLSTGGRHVVDVGLFTAGQAVAYLHDRIGPDDEADKLAADLEYLPLALAQATAYMRDRRLGCAEYRQRFNDRRRLLDDLVPEPGALPDDHRTTLAATWALSIEWANELKPKGVAGPMLELASVLDPNGIPIGLVTAAPARDYLARHRSGGAPVDLEQARDALHGLRRLSLIGIDGQPARTVRVHGLVQRATREQANSRRQDLCLSAADAIAEVWPPLDREPAVGQALRSNIEKVYEFGGDLLWSSAPHPALIRAGPSLGDAGLVSAAVVFWRDMCVVATRMLGADHPETMAVRNHLARWRAGAGDLAGAVAAFEDLLADRLRVLGADHPDTLITRGNLARWQGEAGNPAAAVAATERLLADLLRVLGPDHLDSLAALGNLARWRGEAGDADGALAAFEDLLADRLRVLGADHPDTLTTRGNLARWRGEAGDPAAAVAAMEELLADRIRVMGADHPDTLGTRNNLAYWRGESGDPHGAATATEALLADLLRVLGPDHPDTLGTRGNLAAWRGAAGQPEVAAAALDDLLGDQLRVLGPGHLDTRTTRINLDHWRHEATNRPSASD
ncbi:tetratricopeptide repeat protein [Virgisporangium aurantiacum]|uniref:Tetratricopeptide repeat protein n=1 Tax=Virgisporangium aurantiacum TaxID=175570 RepID=A0A8J3Z7R1_9ACTN|nr:tetratricopeptide repeat protein [Virgisporangium aurantiacum]GIJ58921.1 tetratricopeptide repeat protein [Virgisporangium aurantiacum]